MTGLPNALTEPAASVWTERGEGYRRWEKTVVVGTGRDCWERAAEEVLRWEVKTRSGFSVSPPVAVTVGARPIITAHVLGAAIREPVEVVSVCESVDRVGFAYRTLPGHPVSGEEAFIVHRRGDTVLLTIRSLTRPAREQPWRILYPALLVAQAVTRRRYLRALSR